MPELARRASRGTRGRWPARRPGGRSGRARASAGGAGARAAGCAATSASSSATSVAVLAAREVGVDAVLEAAPRRSSSRRAASTRRERLAELGQRRPAPRARAGASSQARAARAQPRRKRSKRPVVGRVERRSRARGSAARRPAAPCAAARRGCGPSSRPVGGGARPTGPRPACRPRRSARLQQQPGEQRALARPAQADGRAVVADLQRPEDEDVRGQSRDPIPLDRCLAFGA